MNTHPTRTMKGGFMLLFSIFLPVILADTITYFGYLLFLSVLLNHVSFLAQSPFMLSFLSLIIFFPVALLSFFSGKFSKKKLNGNLPRVPMHILLFVLACLLELPLVLLTSTANQNAEFSGFMPSLIALEAPLIMITGPVAFIISAAMKIETPDAGSLFSMFLFGLIGFAYIALGVWSYRLGFRGEK